MKRLIIALLFALGLSAQQPNYYRVVFNAVTAATTGATVTNTSSAIPIWTLTFTVTGAPTGCTISLQSSADNVTFADVTAIGGSGYAANPFTCTGSSSTGVIAYNTYKPYMRAKLTTLSGGTSPTVTAVLQGFTQNSSFGTATAFLTAASLPATCTVGQVVSLTSVSPAQTYYCLTTNTWSLFGPTYTQVDLSVPGTFGAQIAAAISSLPSTGGYVDARGFTGSQSASAGFTIDKPGTYLFGAATFALTSEISVTADHVWIECANTTFQASTSSQNIIHWSGSKGGMIGTCILDGNLVSGVSGLRVTPANESQTAVVTVNSFNVFSGNMEIKNTAEGIVIKPGPAVSGIQSDASYNSFSGIQIRDSLRCVWLTNQASVGGQNSSTPDENTFLSTGCFSTGTRSNTGFQIDGGSSTLCVGCRTIGMANGSSPNATPVAYQIASGAPNGPNDNNNNAFYGSRSENDTMALKILGSHANYTTVRDGAGFTTAKISDLGTKSIILNAPNYDHGLWYTYDDATAVPVLGVSTFPVKTLAGSKFGVEMNPVLDFDVNGNARISGSFYRPDNAGIAMTIGSGTQTIYQDNFNIYNPAGSILQFKIAGPLVTIPGQVYSEATNYPSLYVFQNVAGGQTYPAFRIDNGVAGGTQVYGIDSSGNVSDAGKTTTYNNISTVSNGIPAIYGTSDLTGQTAALTASALYTPAATGMFRVSFYAKVTTAGTTSILGGTTGFVLNYTDGTDSVAQTLTLAGDNQSGAVITIGTGNTTNTTAAVYLGSAMVYAKTGVAMTYDFGYTSTGTAMQYTIHVKVEAL